MSHRMRPSGGRRRNASKFARLQRRVAELQARVSVEPAWKRVAILANFDTYRDKVAN